MEGGHFPYLLPGVAIVSESGRENVKRQVGNGAKERLEGGELVQCE